MSFTDELRKMENKPNVENKENFEKELKEIYANIKNACVKNINKHSANGYIVRHYDNEYCVYGFEFKETLNKDNSAYLIHASTLKNKNDKYYSNIALNHYYSAGRDGYEPISIQKNDCDSYIYSLKNLLVKDGFIIRQLISHAVIDEYETIEFQGFINPKGYLKKHTTDKIVGYVIAFSIEW